MLKRGYKDLREVMIMNNGKLKEFKLNIEKIVDNGKFEGEFKEIMNAIDGNEADKFKFECYTLLYQITQGIRDFSYRSRFHREQPINVPDAFLQITQEESFKFNQDVAEVTKPFDVAMAYIRNGGYKK